MFYNIKRENKEKRRPGLAPGGTIKRLFLNRFTAIVYISIPKTSVSFFVLAKIARAFHPRKAREYVVQHKTLLVFDKIDRTPQRPRHGRDGLDLKVVPPAFDRRDHRMRETHLLRELFLCQPALLADFFHPPPDPEPVKLGGERLLVIFHIYDYAPAGWPGQGCVIAYNILSLLSRCHLQR